MAAQQEQTIDAIAQLAYKDYTEDTRFSHVIELRGPRYYLSLIFKRVKKIDNINVKNPEVTILQDGRAVLDVKSSRMLWVDDDNRYDNMRLGKQTIRISKIPDVSKLSYKNIKEVIEKTLPVINNLVFDRFNGTFGNKKDIIDADKQIIPYLKLFNHETIEMETGFDECIVCMEHTATKTPCCGKHLCFQCCDKLQSTPGEITFTGFECIRCPHCRKNLNEYNPTLDDDDESEDDDDESEDDK